jgi:hypothetical protein
MTPKNRAFFHEAYPEFVSQLVGFLEQARWNSARSVNTILRATYWEIGRRIVEQEQRGLRRAQYGEALLRRLATDLTSRFGKGFSERNPLTMREFFLSSSIPQTPSAKTPGLARREAWSRRVPVPNKLPGHQSPARARLRGISSPIFRLEIGN